MSNQENIHVLIAEDDYLVSEMIRGLLEEMGYTVVGEAADGLEAVEMTESLRPDVVLMDLKMPDMDGIEAAQLICERCPTPVVVLTAHETPSLVVRASEAGVGAYLVKPANARAIERVITVARARFGDLMELRCLNAELQARNEELNTLASTVAHDLQEPLRTVADSLRLLTERYEGQLDASADELIGHAVDGVTQMQELINGLLAYSRVGTQGRDFAPTDCEAVLDRALANQQVAIEESCATVTHGPLPIVMADDVQLGQLFQNLIGNGIKFHGQEPPRVHVSAEQQGDEWLFSVRDNGVGIDPEQVYRVFMIFQRLHTGKEYPGIGIGLAICRKIVERHGGGIWAESQPGEGSTFYFTIPVGDG